MRGVPRHKTKFLKTPSRDDFEKKDQKELIEIEKEAEMPLFSKVKKEPKKSPKPQ